MNSSKVYIKSQKRPTSFKTYKKATVIKTVQYFQKKKTCILMEQSREHTKDKLQDSLFFVFSCYKLIYKVAWHRFVGVYPICGCLVFF